MKKPKIIPTFVSEKHQWSFYYWCLARKELDVSHPLFVVVLDRHSDLQTLSLDERDRARMLDLDNLSQVKGFVSTVLNDRNFISAAMESGLIGDVLIVTQEPNGDPYESRDGKKHRIFYQEYSVRNGFAKILFSNKNRELKKILSIHLKRNSNFALDIDLDFFTYDCGDAVCVFGEEDFKDIFSSDSLIWLVLHKSKLLTIALEPYWSGNAENSMQAFELLKKYLVCANLTSIDRAAS